MPKFYIYAILHISIRAESKIFPQRNQQHLPSETGARSETQTGGAVGPAAPGSSHQRTVLAAQHTEVLLHIIPKFLMEITTKLMYDIENTEHTMHSEIPEHG